MVKPRLRSAILGEAVRRQAARGLRPPSDPAWPGPMASCSARGGHMSDRVLWFPDDVAVGFVEASIGEAVVLRAPARGRVRVPAGAAVHLWVKCPVRGLGLL